MTNPSSPSCYERPLPVDVSKLTNREKFKNGLEGLPNITGPTKGAMDKDSVPLIAPPDRTPARRGPARSRSVQRGPVQTGIDGR
jgi:hypothetical protein